MNGIHIFLDIIALATCVLAQSSTLPTLRMSGGEVAEIENHPYQVSIRYFLDGQHMHICGGTLVKADVVLTAASCVTDKLAFLFRVYAGQKSLKSSTTYSDVIWVKKHEKFLKFSGITEEISTFWNDIAIVRLKKKFDLDKKIATIPMRVNLDLKVSLKCITSGWGATTSKSANISDMLKYAEVQIMDKKRCGDYYEERSGRPLHENVVCAEAEATSTCQGDFGGPLVCEGLLTGIASFGYALPCPNLKATPGIFTEVARYVDWFDLNVNGEAVWPSASACIHSPNIFYYFLHFCFVLVGTIMHNFLQNT